MSIADLATELRRDVFCEVLLEAGYVENCDDTGVTDTRGGFVRSEDRFGTDCVRVHLPSHVAKTSDPPVYSVLFDPQINSWTCACDCGCQGPDPRAVLPHYFERINHVSG